MTSDCLCFSIDFCSKIKRRRRRFLRTASEDPISQVIVYRRQIGHDPGSDTTDIELSRARKNRSAASSPGSRLILSALMGQLTVKSRLISLNRLTGMLSECLTTSISYFDPSKLSDGSEGMF